MAALSDFGGFNDGIILFPAIFMQVYSHKMYLQFLFGLLPTKSGDKSEGRKDMKRKLKPTNDDLLL